MRGGAFADRVFDRVAGSLTDSDRRLAHELAYGVLRLRGRIDHVINALVSGGVERLAPGVLDILRLGAYQLLELDRIPAYAAVSDAVEAAKATAGTGAASLTNAVLRKLSRATWGEFDFPRREDDALGFLSSWGSHPRWMVERWLARWPLAAVERLVDYDNRRPAVYLSVVGSPDEAAQALSAAGVTAERVELSGSSLRVDAPELPRALDLVRAVVQDPGAALVVDYAALDRGSALVDLCAAPGGKAALLAARGHEVWAFDVVAGRLARVLQNRARLQISNLHVARADSTRPPVAEARAVLLDVPCSGTGTLARHPDGRWRLRPADIGTLVELQRRLLDAAAEVLAPGGRLVYATCSLEAEENEGQVEAFMARHPDFDLDPPPCGVVPAEVLGSDGTLRVQPQSHGMDGAYAARLRRRSG